VRRRTAAALGAGSLGVVAAIAKLLLGSVALVSLGLFTDTAQVQNGTFGTDTLDAPTSLNATGGATISLSWTATADTYASGHRVFRSTTTGGPYSQIAEVTPRTATTYIDSPSGGTYYYVVRAFYQNWESANSNEASATSTAPAGQRARTVEFFAGQYDGSATNQNQNAILSFSSPNTFTVNLPESSVDIKDAFVELQAQIGASTATTYAEAYIYFDACVPTCTPAPAAFLTTASLGTNSGEAQTVTLRAQVVSSDGASGEGNLTGYTGGSNLTAQVQYCFDTTAGGGCTGTTSAQIQAATAKLVVTYAYDENSATQANTVVYPLESTTAGDQGSKRAEQASCTVNTNCPLFSYNVQAPEISSQLSQWFDVGMSSEQATGTTTTDHQVTPQVDGNASGPVHYLEMALGGNGGLVTYRVDGLTGYANSTAQSLEIGTNTASTLMGGEANLTYTYLNSAATKTRTVVYPAGEVCTTGCTTKSALTGPTVYFAESGVSIQKAWFRVHSSHGASTTNGTLSLTTKVGANAETAQAGYALGAATQDVSDDGYFVHVIPSADYTELAAATASSGKAAQMTAQWSGTAGGAVSAELVVTYTYTGESGGYIVSHSLFAGQQATAGATSFSTASGAINTVLPETGGTTTIRGAHLLATAKDTSATAANTIGLNLATGSCTASATSTTNTDTEITRIRLWKAIASVVTSSDSQTYTACYDSGQASIHGGVLRYIYQRAP